MPRVVSRRHRCVVQQGLPLVADNMLALRMDLNDMRRASPRYLPLHWSVARAGVQVAPTGAATRVVALSRVVKGRAAVSDFGPVVFDTGEGV